jgi:superfamily II DNA or RNA helicase
VTWVGIDGSIGVAVGRETQQCLAAYKAKPNLVSQDAGIEISNVEGGYGRKQLHELLQNGADAMIASPGRISVVLTGTALYCANEGAPLTPEGLSALMASHLSVKRSDQIGRFGLGFKSVLGITDSPMIISRTGSVRFDRKDAERRIRTVVQDADKTPVLRVAEPVDPDAVAAADPIIAELMAWATTVVCLNLKPGTGWLAEELRSFPAEFLLFTNHITELELDDRTGGHHRTWSARRDGSRVELVGSDGTAPWHVFSTTHEPTAAALQDAGEIAGRDVITVSWAVPDKGRAAAGAFWAAFPTNSRTTLSGIVNAPFKTTEDRHDILKGAYNQEILAKVLPDLVAKNFGALVDPADPGSLLEVLPARGREARSWADDHLNDPVTTAVARERCIPDSDGVPRCVQDVHLTPKFLAEHSRWSVMWSAVPGRPSDWVDSSIDARAERRAKATRLFEIAQVSEATTEEWLEAVAKSGASGSMVAVQLSNQINHAEPDQIAAVRKARTVLCADGTLRAPLVGKIFLPTADEASDLPRYVHGDLVADSPTLSALLELGLRPLDAIGKLAAQCERTKGPAVKGAQVERLWALIRQLPTIDATRTLEASFGRGGTPIRTRQTKIRPVGQCLLPGTVVGSEGVADDGVTVDLVFHTMDRATLAALGAVSGPTAVRGEPGDHWFQEWRDHVLDVVVEDARVKGARVNRNTVSIRAESTMANLDLLPALSDKARAAMTREVVVTHPRPWFAQSEARSAPGLVRFDNPAIWWVRRHGTVSTPLGIFPITDAVRPIAGVPTELLPVPIGLDTAALDLLGVRGEVDLPWWERFVAYVHQHSSGSIVQALYAPAARAGVTRPTRLRLPDGADGTWADVDDVVVTHDISVAAMLGVTHDVCLVSSEEDADTLRSAWGLADGASLMQRSILRAPSGEAEALADHFPGLRAVTSELNPALEIVPCADLSVEVVAEGGPRTTSSRNSAVEHGTMFYLDSLSDGELLTLVNSGFRLGLSPQDETKVLEIAQRKEQSDLAKNVRRAVSVDEKLVALAGEKELRKLIPRDAITAVERRNRRSLGATEIAAMARASAGTGIIKQLAPALLARGVEVPTRMNGGDAATRFAERLGLPEELAGTKSPAREATTHVAGPVRLPALHQYQADTIKAVRLLLSGQGTKRRGLVALPTGSGKTRVAVESIVDHIRDVDGTALVLWIAQSDELCEQAVDTWSYVWRAAGSHRTELTVNRLWASNQASRSTAGAQVVVATDDKLVSLSDQDRYNWLTSADIVVVDEAHTSVSKTYTAIFNWLQRGTRQRDKPLLGLSATPYRGTNLEQTTQLINRYDRNLLTEGLFGKEDPHVYLQRQGILARVEHVELEGMTLTPLPGAGSSSSDEQDTLWGKRIDLGRVAQDADRNNRIIDSIVALEPEMTALVFAASVGHAEVLAAILNGQGVSAAAVSTFTSPAERRDLVRKFKSGEVRVLTNYNVLSQGFDAPKVGAVYVARPTFSLNRYQQMIGRGLRGPKNGGSEKVLIVNIRDNIDAFGEQLAFHHFDELWQAST